MNLRRLAAALAAASTCWGAAAGFAAEPAGAVYPAKSWEQIQDPEAAGWSRAGLEVVHQRLSRTATSGFMAVYAGRVLIEYGDVRTANDVASVRKSLLSMLFGNHVAGGKIRLDKTLLELGIDDIGGLLPGEKEATVRDLLTARSGIFHPASNQGDDSAKAPPRGSRRHGTYFLYNNWDFNALGTIFEAETGQDLYDAFEADLARPLTMQDFDRKAQRKSGNTRLSVHRAYHIRISTRDLARVGYLMLREGNWAGRQLVPRDWVRESTRAVTHVGDMNPAHRHKGPFGYGYLWWPWDGKWATGPYRGAYTAHGLGGQHLSVLPALDLVVAHETRSAGNRGVSHGEFLEILELLVHARCGATPCRR